jgi:hypothetical protein
VSLQPVPTTTESSSYFFNGRLDEVAVYPIQLTASDVLSHYQLGTNQAPDTQAPTTVTGVTGTAAGSSALPTSRSPVPDDPDSLAVVPIP